MYTFFSFEGGGALPEDTSREGCGVGTPEIGRAGCRQLGRLGGDQKNHCTLREVCLLAAPGTAHFGMPYANYFHYFQIYCFQES